MNKDLIEFAQVEREKVSDNANVILATYWLPYPIYHRQFLTLKERRVR